MAHVASKSLLQSQIVVVLWRCRFKHRRTKIRGIAQVLTKSVVSQKRPTATETPAHIDVARVIPTLRGILQQVNPAYRKRCIGNRDVVRKNHARKEAQSSERPAWSNRARPGRRIIDQMRTLKMQSVRSQIAEFERGVRPQTLLDRTTPLFDVLRRRVELESGKTNRRDTQHRWSKIQVTSDDRGRRSEIVALLRFGKDERHVVTLVAPRVHVDGSVKDAKRRV